MATGAIVLPAGSAGAGAALHVTHWLPEGAPKAVVLLAHGYAEHAGRYAHVAKRLTDAGYALYAVDHWGHGKSDGQGGFVPRFSAFTDGMAELLTLVEINHAGVPRLLLGKEFMDAMDAAQAGAPAIRLPILIQHGEADRLTAPQGSRFLFEHVGSKDKRLEIYPGLFHEIYNEPERDAVLADLVGWFDAHVAKG